MHAARIHLAKHAGMQVMELLRRDIKPRDILTPAAFRNALTCEMAIGCSTNSVLHLLALANEAGVPLDLATLNELLRRGAEHLPPCARRARTTSRSCIWRAVCRLS